jgi:RNA polymerase sigma factor (sigma-70 family)
VLTRSEQHALAARARAGDREARNRLVEDNLGLAHRIACRFRRPSEEDFDDYLQAARLSLIRAVELWDPERSKLGYYADKRIRADLVRYMTNQRGHPTHAAALLYARDKAVSRLAYLGITLTSAELAWYLRTTEQRLASAEAYEVATVSLHAGEEGQLMDYLESHERVEDLVLARDEASRLEAALGYLHEDDQLIIRGVYGLGDQAPRQQKELAAELGLSPSALQDRRDRALRDLRVILEGGRVRRRRRQTRRNLSEA